MNDPIQLLVGLHNRENIGDMMDKIFLILGIIISYTYSDVYELYRVSYDGKQKSMEFNGQPNANKINCEYIKKILDQDDYQAVSEGKRKYLCELASKNKSNSMYLYRTTISGSTKEDFEHLQWLCESSKLNPDQMDYCITLKKAARMMYIATFDNN